jgi:phosphate transport system protein
MEHIESQLELLRERLLSMTHVVTTQVQKSKQVLFQGDVALADEVITHDRKVNDIELQIDKDCKNILALYNPVAIDLRFILASLNISLNLERIGDNAESICYTVKEMDHKVYISMLEDFQLNQMFDKAIRMLEHIVKAIEDKDTRLAGKTFKKDQFLNKVKQKSIPISIKLIKKRPDDVKEVLHLLNIVGKVERIGDLAKNISEEIIFHIEAKVVKHSPLSAKGTKKKSS